MGNTTKPSLLRKLFTGKRVIFSTLILSVVVCGIIAVVICALASDYSGFLRLFGIVWLWAGGAVSFLGVVLEERFRVPAGLSFSMAAAVVYGGRLIQWVLKEMPEYTVVCYYLIPILGCIVFYQSAVKHKTTR